MNKWSFKFKFCKVIADNILHVKEYIMYCSSLFNRVEYLIIKYIIEIQKKYIKTNDELS